MAKVIGKERITREVIEREISTDLEDEYCHVLLPKKHRFNNGSFITVFQEALIAISKAELSKLEMKMVLFLLGSAGIGNSININLADLETELSENKSNISYALKQLTARNIVVKATKNGARGKGESNYYALSLNFDRLNYQLAFNGKIKDFMHVQHKDPQLLPTPKELEDKRQLNLLDAIDQAQANQEL